MKADGVARGVGASRDRWEHSRRRSGDDQPCSSPLNAPRGTETRQGRHFFRDSRRSRCVNNEVCLADLSRMNSEKTSIRHACLRRKAHDRGLAGASMSIPVTMVRSIIDRLFFPPSGFSYESMHYYILNPCHTPSPALGVGASMVGVMSSVRGMGRAGKDRARGAAALPGARSPRASSGRSSASGARRPGPTPVGTRSCAGWPSPREYPRLTGSARVNSGPRSSSTLYRRRAIDSSSPRRSRPLSTRWPLIRIPLVLPRSLTSSSPMPGAMQQWRRETSIDSSRVSHSGSRPTTMIALFDRDVRPSVQCDQSQGHGKTPGRTGRDWSRVAPHGTVEPRESRVRGHGRLRSFERDKG